jgi:hypothetical protein
VLGAGLLKRWKAYDPTTARHLRGLQSDQNTEIYCGLFRTEFGFFRQRAFFWITFVSSGSDFVNKHRAPPPPPSYRVAWPRQVFYAAVTRCVGMRDAIRACWLILQDKETGSSSDPVFLLQQT